MIKTTFTHYQAGRRAALRGCHRVLANYPSKLALAEWRKGWDSVPKVLRNTAPKTGPIPAEVLNEALALDVDTRFLDFITSLALAGLNSDQEFEVWNSSLEDFEDCLLDMKRQFLELIKFQEDN